MHVMTVHAHVDMRLLSSYEYSNEFLVCTEVCCLVSLCVCSLWVPQLCVCVCVCVCVCRVSYRILRLRGDTFLG